MNYQDNPYPFRQDSSFLYFFGLDFANLAAVIDVDEDSEIVFGDDLTLEDVIWRGRQASLKEKCEGTGVRETLSFHELASILSSADWDGRTIHFLPQCRSENISTISEALRISPVAVSPRASETLIKAVVAQRSVKTEQEIQEIEAALDITAEMHIEALKMCKPGLYEREVVGVMEGIALSKGVSLAFPTIFSIHGEILHNHSHGNLMKDGDLVVNDSGAESASHYASDITRTIPVSGAFSEGQKDLYRIVLSAQQTAIEAVRPGVEFRNIHRLACEIIISGLKDLRLIKGDVQEAVRAGAHTLVFPCGLGHMLGLDVHDMEALGEDYVGYTDTIRRNPEFGWRSLRLAKALEPGFVVTVEPGIYFIPELIDRWKAEKKCEEFIKYDVVEGYRGFGGVRIEDDVLVLEDGRRVLGRPIPKSVEEVEDACSH